MPVKRPSGRGVPEHLRNLERQTQNSGQAANCRAFCDSETDFRPAIRCLPRVLPGLPGFPSPFMLFILVLPDRNAYKVAIVNANKQATHRRRADERHPWHERLIAMARIYPKSTRQLIEDFVNSYVPPPPEGFGLVERKLLAEGGHFTRPEILKWFQQNYPKIKQGTINAHLIIMSTNAPSRVHHTLRPNGADDLLFQIDGSRFRLYDHNQDPPPIYGPDDLPNQLPPSEDESQGSAEFAYESDLRNYLAKNLSVIKSGLKLYEDEGISGIEFPVGGRFIDILAVDSSGDFVVIELKVSRGYDRVVGQLMRYMAWIGKNQAEPGQRVRGVIVAREISEDLLLACSLLPNVELFEYQLSLALKRVNTGSAT
jgi:hypothetical protein